LIHRLTNSACRSNPAGFFVICESSEFSANGILKWEKHRYKLLTFELGKEYQPAGAIRQALLVLRVVTLIGGDGFLRWMNAIEWGKPMLCLVAC
jgi:hypothetical protein